MPDDNKVINMFEDFDGNDLNVEAIFREFIMPLEKKFPMDLQLEEIFELGIKSWNQGIMANILPEDLFDALSNEFDREVPDVGIKLNEELVARKIDEFPEFDFFIMDIEYEGKSDGDIQFHLTIQTSNDFLDELAGPDSEAMGYTEGYIDRYALTIKPKQPLIDWVNELYSEDPIDARHVEEANIYLFEGEEDSSKESLLRLNYEFLFERELNNWYTDEEAWPQNRSYEMFNNWFEVSFSSMIYDAESFPIEKD